MGLLRAKGKSCKASSFEDRRMAVVAGVAVCDVVGLSGMDGAGDFFRADSKTFAQPSGRAGLFRRAFGNLSARAGGVWVVHGAAEGC